MSPILREALSITGRSGLDLGDHIMRSIVHHDADERRRCRDLAGFKWQMLRLCLNLLGKTIWQELRGGVS